MSLDSCSPSVPIVHRFRQLFNVITEVPINQNPQENITFEFVLPSLAVSSVSSPSYMDCCFQEY